MKGTLAHMLRKKGNKYVFIYRGLTGDNNMRWMEFIKVQTMRANVIEILLDFAAECEKCNGLVDAKVFNHSSVEDCSICLCWNTTAAQQSGSTIGMQMSNTLRDYGLVDHSVWVEIEETKGDVS